MDFLIRLEESGFGTWVRESPSLWAYPTVLFLHTLGLAMVVGLSTAFDLRLIGVAPSLPLTPFKSFYPLIWIGFIINAVSGVALKREGVSATARAAAWANWLDGPTINVSKV